jgi:hypothetical protein
VTNDEAAPALTGLMVEGDDAGDADGEPDEDKDECKPDADLKRHLGPAK